MVAQKAFKWNNAINNPIIERINQQLDIWIDDSINTVNKNFVDKLKETSCWDKQQGVFDKDTYKTNSTEALNRCLVSLKCRLPKQFKKLVSRYYHDVDMFYKNRIDERLKEHELERIKSNMVAQFQYDTSNVVVLNNNAKSENNIKSDVNMYI